MYSYTALSTFLACERKYYYRYIRKIPSVGSIYQYIGRIVHLCLEEILESKINGKQIIDRYNMLYNILSRNKLDNRVDMGRFNSSTLFGEFIKILDNIYINIDNYRYMWDTKIYFIENSFIYSDSNGVNYFVKPDYFYVNKGNYIFDFKVVSRRSVKKYTSELETSDFYIRQLDFYRWVIGNIIGDHNIDTYYFFVVKDGGLFPVKVNSKNDNYDKVRMNNIVSKIVNNIISKGKDINNYKVQPMLCNKCDYINICSKEFKS